MCRAVHARVISDEERKDAAKWTGVMIPVYASIAAVLFAAVVLVQPPRQGATTAVAAVSQPVR